MSELENDVRKHLTHNLIVNLMDGGFFGLGWGFGSLGTIVTLFVSRMTHSPLLIGLIPSLHAVGWQLPQLFMANAVARLRKYKALVLWLTIHERLPYLGLAIIAWFVPALGNKLALPQSETAQIPSPVDMIEKILIKGGVLRGGF